MRSFSVLAVNQEVNQLRRELNEVQGVGGNNESSPGIHPPSRSLLYHR